LQELSSTTSRLLLMDGSVVTTKGRFLGSGLSCFDGQSLAS
jgi:hypothetical protein